MNTDFTPENVNETPKLVPAPHLEFHGASLALDAQRPARSFVSLGDEEDEDNTFLAVMHSLRRSWPLGTAVGLLLAAIAGGLVWQSQQRVFRASALVHVASDDTPLVFTTMDRTGRNPYEVFKSTQQQLITTRFVLNNALSRPEVAQLPVVQGQIDPVKWLKSQLVVEFPGEAEIMEISIAGQDPALLPKLVNGVVDAYLNEVVLAGRNKRLGRLADLEGQQGVQEEKIRKSGESIAKLVDALGTGNEDQLTIAQQGVIDDLNMTRNQLTKVRLARIAARAELGLLQSRVDAKVPKADLTETPVEANADQAPDATQTPLEEEKEAQTIPDKEVKLQAKGPLETALLRVLTTDPVAAPLLIDIDRIDSRITLLESRFNEATAAKELPALKEQLAELNEQLDQRKLELRDELATMRRSDAELSDEDRIELLSLQVVLADEQEAELKKSLAGLDEEVRSFGKKSIILEMERSKLAAYKKISERLTEEILQLQVEINADARIRSLSAAVEPKSFEHRSRLPKALAAAMACFALPFGCLVWLDMRKSRIGCTHDIKPRLKVPVLGAVPPTPRLGAVYRDSHTRWREKLDDSISSIAAMLIRKQQREGAKTIVITSAVSGEGKTTLASHTALALTNAGHRVLLIDFDLRRPALDELFNVNAGPGVCEVLRGNTSWRDAVQATEVTRLTLLTAGQWEGHVLEELATSRLQGLLAEFRQEFDFVVIDSSPVLPIVDTRLIAQHADGVVLSLMRDVSRLPQIETACEILQQYHIPVLGAVLTGIETEQYRFKLRRTPK